MNDNSLAVPRNINLAADSKAPFTSQRENQLTFLTNTDV